MNHRGSFHFLQKSGVRQEQNERRFSVPALSGGLLQPYAWQPDASKSVLAVAKLQLTSGPAIGLRPVRLQVSDQWQPRPVGCWLVRRQSNQHWVQATLAFPCVAPQLAAAVGVAS